MYSGVSLTHQAIGRDFFFDHGGPTPSQKYLNDSIISRCDFIILFIFIFFYITYRREPTLILEYCNYLYWLRENLNIDPITLGIREDLEK